jgi:two-component system, LytTR family, sensor kinase
MLCKIILTYFYFTQPPLICTFTYRPKCDNEMLVLDRIKDNFVAHFLLWVAMCMFVAFILSSSYVFSSLDITYNIVLYLIFGGVSYISLVKNYIHQVQDGQALRYLIALVLVSAIAATMHTVFIGFMHHGTTRWTFKVYIYLAYLFLLIFGSSLEFIVMSNKLKVLYLESEKFKSKQELDLLKTRLEPHFMFNALNNIYSLVKRGDARTTSYILDVSNLLRYIVDESNNEKVVMYQEIEFIESYIQLEKTRFIEGDQCDVKFSTDDISDYMIAPMLTFPFIENAFKHSERSDGKPRSITVSVNYDEGNLVTEISNSLGDIFRGNGHKREVSIGQARKRLLALHPKAIISSNDNTEKYFTKIIIPLS